MNIRYESSGAIHFNFVLSKHHYYGYQGLWRIQHYKYKLLQLAIS